MRFRHLFVCVGAAPMLMAAAQPIRLQPSSTWNVDYAENSCRLSRAFGDSKDAILLSLESEAPGQVDMFVVGKSLKSDSDKVSGRFLPVQGKAMEGHVAQSPLGTAVLWSRVRFLPDELAEKAQIEASHLDFAAKVTELEVDARSGRPLILETGSLGAAIKAFDKCSRDSLRDWGVDPDVEDGIVRRPWSPHVSDWFTSNDYPPAMTVSGQQSDVKVRLLVDATGKATKCTSLSHFKEKSFDQVVCDKFMKRAHFEPAELSDGTKVPSYYVNHVIFRMAD